MKIKLVILLLLGTLFCNSQVHLFDTVSLSISVEPKNNFIPNAEKPAAEDMFDVTVRNQVLNITTHLETPFTVELTSHKLHKRFVLGPFIKQCYHVLPAGGTYSLDIKYNDIIFSGTFDILMTQQEAAEIVLKMFEDEDVDIFLSKRVYSKGDTLRINAPSDKLLIPPFDAWIAFVDLYPETDWAHPCQYILIQAVSGDTIVKDHRDPPLNWMENFYTYKAHNPLREAKIKTAEEAFHFADSIYKGQLADIWVAKSISWGNHKFELPMNDYVIVPPQYAYCWVVFVDLHPMTLWGHACEYLLIDPYYGKFTIIKKDMFPLNLEELFTLIQRDNNIVSNTNSPKPKNNEHTHNSSLNDSAPVDPPYDPTNNKWAIIISGGKNRDENYFHCWNNCSALYKTLISHGYISSHIYVAISDGLDPTPDYRASINPGPDSIYESSPWDLDGDDIADTRYPATYYGISNMFEEVQHAMNAGDEVFIFTTDHGEIRDNHATLELWNNEYILDNEFVEKIVNLNAGLVNILMAQCHSGGFIDEIQNSELDNVVITTACEKEQLSGVMGNYIYSEFVYRWLTAINGISPDSTITDDADYNNDGDVSMQEAYFYACTHDTKYESPQIYSKGGCLKYDLTLTDLLEDCTGPEVVMGISDIYIKDNAADFGTEPNVSTNKAWLSTDIWLEAHGGSRVVIPIQGHTYRVCARVHNRGNRDSPGGEHIYWHWTKSAIGNSWPYSWFDDYYYWCGDNQIPRGGLINPDGTPLPSIPKGESVVVFTNWIVPYIDYSVCSDFDEDVNGLWRYGLLARIVDNQEQPGEDRTEYPLSSFVLESNNVASCNFTILNQYQVSVDNMPAAIVGVAAANMTHDYYHLFCDVMTPNLSAGALMVTLCPEMYNNWTIEGTGFEETYNNGRIAITSDHAELNNFYISGDAFYPVKIEIDTTILPVGDFIFDLYLVDSNDSIVGGERFIYRKELRNYITQKQLYQTEQPSEKNIMCFPNPAHDNVFVRTGHTDDYINIRIYDLQGQCVLTSGTPNINIEQLSNGIYCLSVQTQQGMQQAILLKQ